MSENPFQIPTDEQVFLLRDTERKQKQAEKDRLSHIPVSEKGTWRSKLTVKRYKGDDDSSIFPRIGQTKSRTKKSTHPLKTTTTGVAAGTQKKENMTEFIEKKRKMFLLQMELDTKKFEIKKLEQKAEERERKLASEEAALVKDAHLFDDFLTENDINAVEAINRADEEQKKKASKQQEIKKLNARIQTINTEIAKLDEQLSNCEKYKKFLDDLTPSSWKEEQKEKIRKRSQEINNTELLQRDITDDDIEEMYFDDPQQLLNIFSELETQNLTMIQTTQEIEEQLEELQKMKRQTEDKMEQQANNLRSQIDALKRQILEESEKEQGIKSRAETYGNSENELKMEHLKEKIKEIYIAAQLDYPSTGMDMEPLMMLTKIENKLDQMLEVIEQYDKIDRDFVKKQERQLEKERRKALRDARNFGKTTSQRRRPEKTEEKERKRITGKPLMFRSKPDDSKKLKKRKKKTEKVVKNDTFSQFLMLFEDPSDDSLLKHRTK